MSDGAPFSVSASLDRWIQSTDTPRLPDGKWHPSSLFGCERQAVYEVLGTPKSDAKQARNLRIMRMGTHIHEVIQSALLADTSVAGVWTEVPVGDKRLNIKGHADGLILHDDGTWELLEIKSISLNGFRYLDGPKEEHKGQARTYAYILRTVGSDDGLTGPYDISRIRYCYVSRDDMKIMEFTEPIDPSWEWSLDMKIARLERYVEDGTALPLRLPDEIKKGKPQRHWLCASYCDFRTKCWEQDPEGVDL